MQYEKAQEAWVLLYPEGMVKLNGSAGEILRRCDGERSVAGIVSDLERAFEQEDLNDDVIAFLEIARERGWVALAAGAPASGDAS
jgi:pyrroloquinoline quinone biosynthesis protein D